MIQQVLGNVSKDDLAACSHPLQGPEGDHAVAPADVKERVAFGKGSVLQHPVANRTQEFDPASLVAGGAPVEQSVRPLMSERFGHLTSSRTGDAVANCGLRTVCNPRRGGEM